MANGRGVRLAFKWSRQGAIRSRLNVQRSTPAPMASPRRLAAILPPMLSGYSRLMRADERRFHERLKAHRRELVDPEDPASTTAASSNITGDGMLAEFSKRHRSRALRGRGAMRHASPQLRCRRRAAHAVPHRHQSRRRDRRARGHLRRRGQHRSAARSDGRAERHLHLAGRPRAGARQAAVSNLSISGRAQPRTSHARCTPSRSAPTAIAALPPPVVAIQPLPTADRAGDGARRGSRSSCCLFTTWAATIADQIILPRRLPMTSRPTCRASPTWSLISRNIGFGVPPTNRPTFAGSAAN